MKKIFLYTVLGAAMLASCSQDDSLDVAASRGGELSFRTSVGTVTRANVADLDMVKTNGFKVTAYLYGMDGETKKVQATPYFEDMAVTWNTNAWSHAQRYWPGSNETVETGVAAQGYDFVAYSPSATTGVSYDGNKMKVTDYTIPASVADEKDLVVANAQNQTEAANGTNGVSLDFKHVLSQVVVKATNASSFYHIDVEKVEIHNVHGKGTLTYDYAATSPATWAITDATVSSNAYTSALASAATLGTTASALHANDNFYMMLPQTSGVWNPETEAQTAAGAYFVVSCKIYSGEGANKEYLFGIGSASGYGRVAIPVPANGTGTNEGKLVWENGKKYTYTLNFFKDGGGAGYQEPGSTAPSKSITPSTVKFSASVCVEAWGEGSLEPETPASDPNLLSGVFSVSDTKTVKFTKGNLQATYSTSTSSYSWGFATNQWDYIGNEAGNCTMQSDGTNNDGAIVDLFGWSTDATNNNWGTHTKTSDTDGYTTGSFKDWGTLSDFSGRNYSTLSSAEWAYLLNTRTVNGGTGEGKSCQRTNLTLSDNSTVYGMLIAPDGYTGTLGETTSWSDWQTMESTGVVFLPASGFRFGSGAEPETVGSIGSYWSSTADGSTKSYSISFGSWGVQTDDSGLRFWGGAVRLVK